MAQTFKDLSIVEPRANPFTGANLSGSNIVSAGCCQGVGERVFQLEKSDDTDLQIISGGELSTGDFVVKFRAYPSADEDSIGFIFWRTDDNNYYELRLSHLLLNRISVNRVTNGVATEVVSETTVTSLTKQVAYIRVKINSTSKQIQARVWLSSVIEPTAWSINSTLTQNIADTATGYGFSQASARSVDWHWFSVSDVASEPAYKSRIPASDTTIYPGGNLTVSGAGYYHRDDEDGLGRPAISATARVYHQLSGALISRGTTDTSARFSRSDLKTSDVCYATFSPTDLDSSLETGIINLLMPALVPTDTHTVPAGAPSALPGTFYILHLGSDAGNLARVGKTDGSNFTASELLSVDDQLVGYRGFNSSGALKVETWTVTSLDTNTAGRAYQLVYVDQDIETAPVIGTATYDDRVLYATITRRTPVASTLGALTDVTITSPADKQGLIYEAASTSWKNKFPSIIVDTDDFEGDGSSDASKLTLKEPFTKSDQAKIDETYDLLRTVDDTFAITPARSGSPPDLGFANRVGTSGAIVFGSVAGTNPPTFTVGTNTYRILQVSYNPTTADVDLSIYIGGANNAATNVPRLPDQLEFSIGGNSYRSRIYEDFYNEKSGASDAYWLYSMELDSGIFTAGTPINFQVLLTTAESKRLLPTQYDDGDVLQIKNNTPVFDAISGGAATKTPVVASLSVVGRAESTIATRVLGNSIKLYFELADFDIREQLTVTGVTNITYRVRIRDTVTDAPIFISRPFTLQSLNPTRVVLEVARLSATAPNGYKITIEGIYAPATTNTLTNVSSILYPRTRVQYDGTSATNSNPPWRKINQFRQFTTSVGGWILPSSSSTSQPVTRSNLEAMAYWNLRNYITVVSSTGQVVNYRNYSYPSVVNSTSYRWTIPDATTPAYCTWDTSGQYFYYVTGGASPVLRCFDMGTTSATPTPTRITSREFAVNALATGQTGIFGVCDFHLAQIDFLAFLTYNGTNYEVHNYNITSQVRGSSSTVPLPHTGATPAGIEYDSVTNRFFIHWQTYSNNYEIICYSFSFATTYKDLSFPLGFPNTSPKVKDISIRNSSSAGYPIYTAHNPALSSASIRGYTTIDNITASTTINDYFLPLSVYDTTTPVARYLYQIIEDTSNGKLYFLYGAQSRYWTDDSILLVERRTSFDDPTVEATSAVYGSTYGWRNDAPLAGGFLKGTKIYCPQRNQSGSTVRFHSIDLASNFTLSTSPEFTVTIPTPNTGNAFTCWGNGTTFWVQRVRNAYAFKVSDYTRDSSKDIIGLRGSGWAPSAQRNTLTGDSDHLIACVYGGSFQTLYYYRKEDGAYVTATRFYAPVSRQGAFFNQYVPSTLTNTEPDTRGFAYYSTNRATPVYGAVLARIS